jgi:hypothetical protein
VHFRHPSELGGAYFFFNALMSQASVLVSAFLYWRYYVSTSAGIGRILEPLMNSTTDNSTVADRVLANFTGTPFVDAPFSANPTSPGGLDSSKIDGLALAASVGTLMVMWVLAVVSLSLTIKPEYRCTFYSTQAGYAYALSFFLDNEGDDAKRIGIFYFNERQWRAIRDRVKEWVLSMYATWEALKPVWFTDALKALIPDSFMPAEALRQENARVPGGRRETLANTSMRRRMTLTLGAESRVEDTDRSALEIAVQPPA